MKIAICDDELMVINSLKTIIETYLIENLKEFEIMTFQLGTQLLQSVFDFDVIFLDIYICGIWMESELERNCENKIEDVKLL